MRKYGHDYKLVVVGDASMSPYELEQAGGSVEHWNDEPGRTWLARYEGASSTLDMGQRPSIVRPGSRVPYVPGAALVDLALRSFDGRRLWEPA